MELPDDVPRGALRLASSVPASRGLGKGAHRNPVPYLKRCSPVEAALREDRFIADMNVANTQADVEKALVRYADISRDKAAEITRHYKTVLRAEHAAKTRTHAAIADALRPFAGHY